MIARIYCYRCVRLRDSIAEMRDILVILDARAPHDSVTSKARTLLAELLGAWASHKAARCHVRGKNAHVALYSKAVGR